MGKKQVGGWAIVLNTQPVKCWPNWVEVKPSGEMLAAVKERASVAGVKKNSLTI